VTPDTLIEIARKARELIQSAEASGLEVDEGNVVDLIADNVDASLDDIRAALVVAGYGDRFPRAIAGKRTLTFEDARAKVRKLGNMTIRKGLWDDYRVNFRDGREKTAYYTDDLADAVATARIMSNRGA
jgi:hypothetical protein